VATAGKIRDPGELERELNRTCLEYNTVPLHASIGYITPDDEHTGRDDAIRCCPTFVLHTKTPLLVNT
jgi:hypothetical protein